MGVFLNGVTEYLLSGETDTNTVAVLQSYLGSLDRTCLTLFMSISGGVSWELIVNALLRVHAVYGLLFVLFVASMMLAALNIFAGVFVNDAIEVAQQDRDLVLQMESSANRRMMKELREMFLEFDTDESGTLTREEFMEAWQDPEVMIRFRQLGVELRDAKSLFEMLGIADNDELAVDEFVDVCLRAKTLTRPVDLQSFLQQNRRTTDSFKRAIERLDRNIGKLVGKVNPVSDFGRSSPTHSLAIPHFPPRNRLSFEDSAPSTPMNLRVPPSAKPVLM